MAITILFVPFEQSEKTVLIDDAISWRQHSSPDKEVIIFRYGEGLSNKIQGINDRLKIYILGHGIDSAFYPAHISSTTDLSDEKNVVLDMGEVAKRFEKSFGVCTAEIEAVKLYFCNKTNGSRVAKAFRMGLVNSEDLKIQYYVGDVSSPCYWAGYRKLAVTKAGVVNASKSRHTIFYYKNQEFLSLKQQDKIESTKNLKERMRDSFWERVQTAKQYKVKCSRHNRMELETDDVLSMQVSGLKM